MRHLCLTASLALLTSCAYSQEDGQRLANEVYAQSTQLQALQKSSSSMSTMVERHDDDMAGLMTEVEALSKAARRNDADLVVRFDDLLQEVAQLKGLVESTRERVQSAEAGIYRVAEDQKIGSASTEEEKAEALEAAKARDELLKNPKKLAKEVIALMNDRKIQPARALLVEFNERARGNKKLRRHLDTSHYLIAESYFLEGEYKRAAQEYNLVRKEYPKSDKAPDAFFKLGLCFERGSMGADAKYVYTQVRKRYPKSKAAKQAAKRLKAMKKKS